MPTDVQFGLLLLTSALFGAAFVLGWQHQRSASRAAEGVGTAPREGLPHDVSIGSAARAAVLAALAAGVGLLIWRATAQGTFSLPASDPFDAFLLMGLLLALVVMYFRWTRHLGGLGFFLLPLIVILLLTGAGLAALSHPAGERPDYSKLWTILHVVTIVAGTLCFALGCAAGVAYLLADRQLRRRGHDQGRRWAGFPPLASMEKFNMAMVYLGFPLLTIATIAGILRMAQHPAFAEAAGAGLHLKVVLGSMCWLVYAVLAHVPLNPRLRGRHAAWLSILGFALFLVTYIVSSAS